MPLRQVIRLLQIFNNNGFLCYVNVDLSATVLNILVHIHFCPLLTKTKKKKKTRHNFNVLNFIIPLFSYGFHLVLISCHAILVLQEILDTVNQQRKKKVLINAITVSPKNISVT